MGLRENILPQKKDALPEVGYGATLCVGSDRYAYTVVGIEGKKRKVITIERFNRRENVSWRANAWRTKDNMYVSFSSDAGEDYRDPSF